MKYLKHLCLAAASITSLLVLAPAVSSQVSALDIFSGVCNGTGAATDVCKQAQKGASDKANPVISVIKVVIDILSFVIGAVAVIGIVISGLRLIVANGDTGSINAARSGLQYSLIGIAVTILAQVIVLFVLDKLKI